MSPSSSGAADALVPAELQARLLAKLCSYDRNFEKRADDAVRVLLAVMPDNGKSKLAVATMAAALANLEDLGGLRHERKIVDYDGADEFAARVRREKVSIVYIPPGFDDEIPKLGEALTGVNVLSVSPIAAYVRQGIVLGFELVSGKPQLVLNLPQAKRQNVDFKSSVLKLAKVYR